MEITIVVSQTNYKRFFYFNCCVEEKNFLVLILNILKAGTLLRSFQTHDFKICAFLKFFHEFFPFSFLKRKKRNIAATKIFLKITNIFQANDRRRYKLHPLTMPRDISRLKISRNYISVCLITV